MVDSSRQMPSRLENAQRFYDALVSKAEVDDEGMLRFEGHTTPIFTGELGFKLSYYAPIRHYLLALGCIQQVQRGARNSLSVWRLVQRPSIELQTEADPATLTEPGNLHERIRILEARQREIEESLGGLDVKTILEAMAIQMQELKPARKRSTTTQGSK